MVSVSHFLICTSNDGWDDLRVLKVYRRLPDELAESNAMVRIVDESGEDYLYQREAFLEVPSSLEEKLETAELLTSVTPPP